MGREDRRLVLWFILFFVSCGIPLAAVLFVFPNAPFPSILLIVLDICFVALYADWLYVRYYKKRKPRYPIVPPEGKPDIYSRANIPRPIYEDFRRMQEKKKRFAKLKRLRRRTNKKKG